MGNAGYCMPCRDDSACSERYADDIPLSLSYRQFPPTDEPASKQSKGIPRACRTWHDAIPDDPAPMMHTRLTSSAPFDVLLMLGERARRRHRWNCLTGTQPAGGGGA